MPIFDHITYQNRFQAEPYQHIDPGVSISNGGASSRHYRVIGAKKFLDGPDIIYFDIFDETGKLIHPSWIEWNWLENSGGSTSPAMGDKPPAQEPSGNIGMIDGVHIWLEVKDFVSERVVFPPPDKSSWYVCFQLVDADEPPEPEPPPEPDPPPGQPPAIPINLQVISATDTTISLRWSVVDQVAERFKVSWSKNMLNWQELTAQMMEATIPNLLPDSLYLIRVQAVNQYGESPPAEKPARTDKAPDNPSPPEPTPDNPNSAGTWRVAVSPQQTMVIPLEGDIVDQPDLHTATTSYVLVRFSLAELKRIIADMETRGDDFVELGLPLVLRSEYKS